jgi:hypothetical protein
MRNLKFLFMIDRVGTGGTERDLAEKLPQLRSFKVAPIG